MRHGPSGLSFCIVDKSLSLSHSLSLSLLVNPDLLCKERTRIPFTQGCLFPSLFEIGPVVHEKIFKIRQCIFAIHLLLFLGKRRSPLFEQFLIFLDQGWFEPSLVTLKLAHWVRRRYLSFINVLIYTTFFNIFPLEKVVTLHLNDLNYCVKFCWN